MKIEGSIAEVGTFEGGTAKLICEAKKNKTFFIFDTFEGLPEVDEVDSKQFVKGQFKSNFSDVKNYLNGYSNVYLYKGFFPDQNADAINNEIFSFVHLDVDLYKSTYDCLKFFYKRMAKGGIILSHDYSLEGVNLAFNEFFNDKPEVLIELLYDQVMIIKS